MNINHIKDKFDLNDLETTILNYLDNNQDNLSQLTIRQVAKDNYTSTSAIFRLCKKLGFSGYKEMIYHLINKQEDNLFDNQYDDYQTSFSNLLNKHRNSRIIVYGMGFSAPIADYICQRLTLNGFCAMSVIHTEMFHDNLPDKTLFIVISNSGITPRLIDLVEQANQQKIEIIAFIASKNNKIGHLATLPIIVDRYDSFTHDNLVPNTFFGNTLIVFESLLYSFLSSQK